MTYRLSLHRFKDPIRRATLAAALSISAIGILAGMPAKAADFVARDATRYDENPNLAPYGLKDITVVYAHNDDMALGAAQAIEEAGLKPGKDIIMVSIDAIGEAVKAVADGRLNCVVECNPLFGPKVYDTAAKILRGETVPKKSFNKDELFDETNAAQVLPMRKY